MMMMMISYLDTRCCVISDYTHYYLFLHFAIVSSSVFKSIDIGSRDSISSISMEEGSISYNAIDVVNAIVGTVSHLFGCMDCR